MLLRTTPWNVELGVLPGVVDEREGMGQLAGFCSIHFRQRHNKLRWSFQIRIHIRDIAIVSECRRAEQHSEW